MATSMVNTVPCLSSHGSWARNSGHLVIASPTPITA